MNQREGDEDERRDVIASNPSFQPNFKLKLTCHSRPAFQALSMYDHQHRGFWPSGGRASLSLHPGFKPHRACMSSPRCFICFLGLQGVQWIWKLIVMYVSWPKHPKLLKKKYMYDHQYLPLLL
jgi:hypothetical protein